MTSCSALSQHCCTVHFERDLAQRRLTGRFKSRKPVRLFTANDDSTMEKYFIGNLSKTRLINRLVARRSTSAAPYGAYRTGGWCGPTAR
jgi:hypothetical protein